jgi:hypothetical protein
MGSRSPWKIEGVRRLTKTDEDIEWFECNPGPSFRAQLRPWWQPGLAGPDYKVVLRVIYLATGQVREARINKDSRTFRAYYDGAYLTLEEATKKMKEDLRLRR